jgi:hypothetical protein
MIYRLAGLGDRLDDPVGEVVETRDACESVEIFAGPAFLRELRRSDITVRFAA